MKNYENPFYYNYVFNKSDLKKMKMKMTFIDRLSIMFKTAYCQINTVETESGYQNLVFTYKVNRGKYYLLKVETISGILIKDFRK